MSHTTAAVLAPLGRIAAGSMPPATASFRSLPTPSFVTSQYAGRGRLVGTTKTKATPDFPTYAKVRVVRELDAVCVAEEWSDPVTGAWQFDYLDMTQRYTILAYEPTGLVRAAIASGVLPEPMP